VISLENLKVGLHVLAGQCENIEDKALYSLLKINGRLEVLVEKAFRCEGASEIAYTAQEMQFKIFIELQKRIEK